jgi:hypothetical protein
MSAGRRARPIRFSHHQSAAITRITRSILSCRRHSRWSNLQLRWASDVEWFVNNERILPQHDGRFFWQLAPGKWNIRAVTHIGTDEETVTVE